MHERTILTISRYKRISLREVRANNQKIYEICRYVFREIFSKPAHEYIVIGAHALIQSLLYEPFDKEEFIEKIIYCKNVGLKSDKSGLERLITIAKIIYKSDITPQFSNPEQQILDIMQEIVPEFDVKLFYYGECLDELDKKIEKNP